MPIESGRVEKSNSVGQDIVYANTQIIECDYVNDLSIIIYSQKITRKLHIFFLPDSLTPG